MNQFEKQLRTVMLCLAADSAQARAEARRELERMLNEPPARMRKNVDGVIGDVLLELGVPDNLAGHEYLAVAIKRMVTGYRGNKTLYQQVADMFSTTYSKVERAIRYAVEDSWKRMDFKTRDACFGSVAVASRGNPTNMVFICRAANMVRKRMEEAG